MRKGLNHTSNYRNHKKQRKQNKSRKKTSQTFKRNSQTGFDTIDFLSRCPNHTLIDETEYDYNRELVEGSSNPEYSKRMIDMEITHEMEDAQLIEAREKGFEYILEKAHKEVLEKGIYTTPLGVGKAIIVYTRNKITVLSKHRYFLADIEEDLSKPYVKDENKEQIKMWLGYAFVSHCETCCKYGEDFDKVLFETDLHKLFS